jgi:death-on-curing protein
LQEIRYLTSDELIEVNRIVLKEIVVRKADRPQVLSYQKIEKLVEQVSKTEDDVYDKPTILLVGLVKQHPFASGNRRTAYVATKFFLESNGYCVTVTHSPGVLQGGREGFYTTEEIKSWLKGSAIREFTRD